MIRWFASISPTGGADAPQRQEAITYAYLPQYSHTISFQRHRALLQYLRQTTGLPLRQIFPDTFDEHIAMVERGEIDISFSNPFVYIKLAELGSNAFARIVEPSGKPYFQGQVICRSDNPTIRKIEDCRGKRWIAVDPGSAGGYLFPLGLFMITISICRISPRWISHQAPAGSRRSRAGGSCRSV